MGELPLRIATNVATDSTLQNDNNNSELEKLDLSLEFLFQPPPDLFRSDLTSMELKKFADLPYRRFGSPQKAGHGVSPAKSILSPAAGDL